MLRISVCLIAVFLTLSAAAPAAELTPAQRLIEAAERALELTPDSAPRLNDLALAYTKRARETSDISYYDRALETLERSLAIDSTSYEARRVRVWALLGKHEFAAAHDEAVKLRNQAPDDVFAYGLLADSCIELGRYDEALDAVQWMLDLRPGNVPGLTRAAYLRELRGWTAGAITFMRQALERTPARESEDRAWLHVHLAHLEQQRGNLDAAEQHVDKALELFPGYHYALAQLGRIRMEQKRYDEAVEAFAKRYQAAPHPENLYELAQAQSKAGLDEQAAESYKKFAKTALAESTIWDNANRELVAYLADRDPKQALEIAEKEFSRRKDVFTRDAYAWALYHVGELEKAREEMTETVAVGLRDKRIERHAAELGIPLPKPPDFESATN